MPDISVNEFVKEMLEVQAKSYRTLVEMLLNEVKDKLKSLRKDVVDLKSSLQFTQKDVDENKSKVEDVQRKSMIQATMIDSVMNGLDDLDGKADCLENQSRRNNIKVFGIPEEQNESWESCESKVKKAIADKLQIKDEITIERAHRVGPCANQRGPCHQSRRQQGSQDGPRPIVAKLMSWKQKTTKVIKEARTKKPKEICFREDFSNKVLARREELVPEMLQARQEGHTAYLVMDRLIIRKKKPPDGTESTAHNDHEDEASFKCDTIPTVQTGI